MGRSTVCNDMGKRYMLYENRERNRCELYLDNNSFDYLSLPTDSHLSFLPHSCLFFSTNLVLFSAGFPAIFSPIADLSHSPSQFSLFSTSFPFVYLFLYHFCKLSTKWTIKMGSVSLISFSDTLEFRCLQNHRKNWHFFNHNSNLLSFFYLQ